MDSEADECRGTDADWFSASVTERVLSLNEEIVGVPLLATVGAGAAAEFTGTEGETSREAKEGETVDWTSSTSISSASLRHCRFAAEVVRKGRGVSAEVPAERCRSSSEEEDSRRFLLFLLTFRVCFLDKGFNTG